MTNRYESWGRVSKSEQKAYSLFWLDDPLPKTTQSLLPYGLGRSYGDCCLNSKGILLTTSCLNRFIEIDFSKPSLRCEAGVTFDEILRLLSEKNLFLPVVPGTKYITVGGAIANDVHGKNHHCAGAIGRYVKCFELERSDGRRLICSPSENSDFYSATIGGLGLTGLIRWAEIELKRIPGPGIEMESIKFQNIAEFFDLSAESNEKYEYTVAWIDSFAKGENLGRGIFMRGSHAVFHPPLIRKSALRLSIPFDMPSFVLNPGAIRLFNQYYFSKQHQKKILKRLNYDAFFFPLDGILHWNRLYGKRGFFQYQCVIPCGNGIKVIEELLKIISHSGLGSFLAVLKIFGSLPSPGLLSFPRPGVTLALDFANCGKKVLELFKRLDAVVSRANGCVYPAKDSRLSPELFKAFFPQWSKFMEYKDPHFNSDFCRRITGEIE